MCRIGFRKWVSIAMGALFCACASANPVVLNLQPLPSGCDAKFSPGQIGQHNASEELGTGSAFPSNESIQATAKNGGALRACASDGAASSVLVDMVNQSGQSWINLFYVAEPETTIANPDFLINNRLAFRIDSLGLNKTLVSESMGQDGIFQVGETWTFLIDGYANGLGLDAHAMGVLGVPSPTATFNVASGNVVAMNCVPEDCCAEVGDCFVPEPGTLPLVGLALVPIMLLGLNRKSAGRFPRR